MRWGRLACCLVLAACADDASFTARFASDFAPSAPHTVSLVGVYKDGRLSSDSWDTLAPRLSAAFGATACTPLYGAPLLTQNAALASAIDDYARANGPGDDLMAQLAPAAKGDLVAVVTLSGRLPQPPSAQDAGAPPTSAPPMGGGRGMRGGRVGMGGGGRRAEPTDTSTLELSVSLYSVSAGHAVGLIALAYSGTSVDDAIARFAAKVAAELPGARCDVWRSVEQLDAQKVRDSINR
jgi:hypothetical protein